MYAIADLTFTPDTLPGGARAWYDRVAACLAGEVYPDAVGLARGGNGYAVARWVNIHVSALVLALRATGDPAYLAQIADIADAMRASTTKRGAFDVWTYRGPGGGEPEQEPRQVDDTLTLGLLGRLCHVFELNRGVHARYAALADYWLDFTWQWLAYWDQRPGGLTKDLTHCWVQHVAGLWLLGEAAGLDVHKNHARAMWTRFVNGLEPRADGYYWDHRVIGGTPQGPQEIDYVSLLFGGLIDLYHESPLVDDDMMRQFVGTVERMVRANGSVAQYNSGGGDATLDSYLISLLPFAGRWSPRVAQQSAQLWQERDAHRPRRVHIPAALLYGEVANA